MIDITVWTDDPHTVAVNEIADAFKAAGYDVATVTVVDRDGNVDSAVNIGLL